MKLVNVEAFAIHGLSQQTNNQIESSAEAKIARLWAQFFNTYPAENPPLYGVYSDYTRNADGGYRVTVGSQTILQAPATMLVQAGTYLAISVSGPMPQAMADAWASVWSHFSTAQPYQRLFATDVEAYHGPATATLYVGVEMCASVSDA